ncbi:hypothetical protein, partial [Clostridium tarantellae]
IIIFFLIIIAIINCKNITNNYCNYKIDKEEYMNLIAKTNIDIFLYDTSNILNNIQGKDEIDLDTINEIRNISYFYKELLNKFKSINPPKEVEKNNELLIISIENCVQDLENILINKDKVTLKEDTINFIKSNDQLIKALEKISSFNI